MLSLRTIVPYFSFIFERMLSCAYCTDNEILLSTEIILYFESYGNTIKYHNDYHARRWQIRAKPFVFNGLL